MIDHVTEMRWVQPDGKMGFCYHVYYSGTKQHPQRKMHRVYTWQQNLPMTVLAFILGADCETEYLVRGSLKNTRSVYKKSSKTN